MPPPPPLHFVPISSNKGESCVFQSQPSGSGPAGVALLCRASLPRFSTDLLQQREQTSWVSCHVPNGVRSPLRGSLWKFDQLVITGGDKSSSCLPVSPYGPSCLCSGGCSPCPCPSSPWALASPHLRIKALIWLQGTLMSFLFGKCLRRETGLLSSKIFFRLPTG